MLRLHHQHQLHLDLPAQAHFGFLCGGQARHHRPQPLGGRADDVAGGQILFGSD